MSTTEQVEKEDTQVYDWRFGQFLRQGFNNDQAELLALVAVDHHESQALLDRGCAFDQAVRILC